MKVYGAQRTGENSLAAGEGKCITQQVCNGLRYELRHRQLALQEINHSKLPGVFGVSQVHIMVESGVGYGWGVAAKTAKQMTEGIR